MVKTFWHIMKKTCPDKQPFARAYYKKLSNTDTGSFDKNEPNLHPFCIYTCYFNEGLTHVSVVGSAEVSMQSHFKNMSQQEDLYEEFCS